MKEKKKKEKEKKKIERKIFHLVLTCAKPKSYFIKSFNIDLIMKT